MPEPARKRTFYDALYTIPENMVGEIINGELIATPRPSRKHANVLSSLGAEIVFPYHFGRGGPGGWIILGEPEIAFGEDILVPDLAGWKRERFPQAEDHNWVAVIPDWICEILSPNTARIDRIKKMRIYSQHKVPYTWLIDPIEMTLEVYKLGNGIWMMLGAYAENEKVRAEPFPEIELDLRSLWLENILARR